MNEYQHHLSWHCFWKYSWVLLLLLLIWRLVTLDHDLMVFFASLRYPSWRLRKHFSGKVIWITGASSGLGRALAVQLAQFPCVLVLSARRKEELEKVKLECESLGRVNDVMVLPMDSLEFDELPSLVASVLEKYEKIDFLVNNAGRAQRSLAENTELAVDKAIMELNYFGYVALTKAVLPSMIDKNNGTIVAISSITGKMGVSVQSGYVASKYATQGFFDSLRTEVFSYGINVCTVCPGPVDSNIGFHSFTETVEKAYNQRSQGVGLEQSVERFAELTAVVLAAKLPESWISIQPYLMSTYIAQYFPVISKSFLGSYFEQSRIRKFKRNECLY